MNDLQIFQNEEFGAVRSLEIDGKPFFVANDVARALGYASPADAVTQHCKGSVKHRYLTNGGEQELKVIPEGDVYRLIVRSKLPSAEKFEHWVFDEVIPDIRKTGGYSLPKTYAEALRALADETEKKEALQAEKKALESQVAVKDQQIAVMQPKVSYCDMVLQSNDLIPITTIAKDYGWTPPQMNKFLNNLGIQYKIGKQWYLYAKYADCGYVGSKTWAFSGTDDNVVHAKTHTYWTQKGRLFLYNKLKEQGILPIMERPKQLELPDYKIGGIWS